MSAGRHSLKVGAELRTTGVSFFNQGGSGNFYFSRDFTMGPDPNTPGAASGESFASFLLGYPSSGSISTSSPIDVYLKYWAAYAQDDIRVSDRLTLTAGLRYEREQGLQERANRMTVGWASDQAFPLQPGGLRPDGTPLVLTGGFLYAGEEGAATHQGAPNARQFSPRLGAAFLLTSKTIVHAGYGVFWAPPQGINASESGSGTRGYNQTTNYIPSLGSPFTPCATCTLTNPFPAGVIQPEGSAMGRLTGVGGSVYFVDPQAKMAHFHRYSMDLQHELRGMVRVELAYLGSVGRNLAGSVNGGVQVNQLDPKYMALGSALQEQMPNPFLGSVLAVGILSGPTVSRAQLLRPYPQFDAIEMVRASLSRSRYDALIVATERRLNRGWGARASYTLSRLQDSQYSESNFFSGGSTILNAYDVEREYGLSVLDARHQLRLTGVVELPLGLMVSVAAGYHSGFPISVVQGNNNTGLLSHTQRPNIVPGVNPRLTGDPEDAYDPTCGCVRWLNPAAWSQAAPFTFGDGPRTYGGVRTPSRGNWDVAVEKTQRVGAARLSLRAEVINLLNDADLRGPNIAFGSATFGQIRDVGGFPRMLQLSARVGW